MKTAIQLALLTCSLLCSYAASAEYCLAEGEPCTWMAHGAKNADLEVVRQEDGRCYVCSYEPGVEVREDIYVRYVPEQCFRESKFDPVDEPELFYEAATESRYDWIGQHSWYGQRTDELNVGF